MTWQGGMLGPGYTAECGAVQWQAFPFATCMVQRLCGGTTKASVQRVHNVDELIIDFRTDCAFSSILGMRTARGRPAFSLDWS